MATLVRRLGLFDAALIVMGDIIGSGIFRNPAVVAQRILTPALIRLVSTVGGFVALLGAFVLRNSPQDGLATAASMHTCAMRFTR